MNVAGGPLPATAADLQASSAGYYGRPVLKPPVWTWEIPVYFFVGGLAGMAAAIAFVGLLAGASDRLVATALYLAAAGAVVSPALLVSDLGRPRRFLYMLRVFKPRSPMSVGSWILSAFGATVVPAAALVFFFDPLAPGAGLLLEAAFWIVLAAGGLLGLALATYTGVLLAATAVPAWAAHRRLLPFHFGVAALGSAAAALELTGLRTEALGVLGLAAAATETAVALILELRKKGPVDRALRHGRAGRELRLSGLLAGPVALFLRLLGLVPAAALAFLAGALLSRFGWIHAGQASAEDPEAALTAQR